MCGERCTIKVYTYDKMSTMAVAQISVDVLKKSFKRNHLYWHLNYDFFFFSMYKHSVPAGLLFLVVLVWIFKGIL